MTTHPPGTEVTLTGETKLTVRPDQGWWTEAQQAALVAAGLGEVPQGDLIAFLHLCQKSGLDPFTREVYLIGYKDSTAPGGKKWSTQTGIDGYRHIAERTGEFLGTLGPWWCGPDGQWVDVWLHDEPPAAARVGILRAGHPEPFYAVAPYREFAVLKEKWEGPSGNRKRTGEYEPNAMWAKMPAHMLAKCAEALAIRRAFPRQTSGIYTTDEMGARMQAQQDEQEREAIEARERSRAEYVRRPWDKEATESPASPADTAPGDVVPGETVAEEEVALPTMEELHAELHEAAEILDTTVVALCSRAAAMYRKNWEDFHEGELLALLEAIRPHVAEAARQRTEEAVTVVAASTVPPDAPEAPEGPSREDVARAQRIAESAEVDADDARARADRLAREEATHAKARERARGKSGSTSDAAQRALDNARRAAEAQDTIPVEDPPTLDV